MSDEPIRRRVTVSGRVQGVFFRDSVRRRALLNDVSGWVTNRTDGAVEAVFEGTPDDVAAMLAFVRRGPPQADVDSVNMRDEDPEGLTGFEVR